MTIREHIPLNTFTSFGVGGEAERLVTIESDDRLPDILNELEPGKRWVLGYGTNVLVSDKGLPGTTILLRNKQVDVDGSAITADAGAWWDDVVKTAVNNHLWGIELMSGIPGSVGAGVLIDINAYGQGIPDAIRWVEAWDRKTNELRRFDSSDLHWGYKHSIFQEQEYSDMVILRVGFSLSRESTTPLTYQSALDVANDLGLKPTTLASRRRIILETRARAESIFVPGKGHPKTVGSFFKNPLVTKEQEDHIITFDETGKSKEQIRKMNRVHGGDVLRVSANHVLLAAGFSRGQSWGNVRLHPNHILKLENTGGATAQEIYDVAQRIIETVKEKLDISLEPEAQILGTFR